MVLFWYKLLKTVFFGQNGFILAIACKNSGFCQNSLTLGRSAQKLGVLAKMALVCQKLLKTVLLPKIASFWQNE